MASGLAIPQNVRGLAPNGAAELPSVEVVVDGADENDGKPRRNADGTTSLDLDDGSVEINLDPPSEADEEAARDTSFEANLALKIDGGELATLANELITRIQEDNETRREWLQVYADNLSLLGLEVNRPGVGAAGGTAVESQSNVNHPLLLESILHFQANANGEFLPSDGPVKIEQAGQAGGQQSDDMAEALERDMNFFLTDVATEYYPDTDSMFLRLAYGGTTFKKVYFCPVRSRPVSESIDPKDLIVSNSATNLEACARVTHRVMMTKATLRRMMFMGVYREVELPDLTPPDQNAVDRRIQEMQGTTPNQIDIKNADREIYECYCNIELNADQHKVNGKPTGIPTPYRVTIDLLSRQILEIRRNWEKDDELAMPLHCIVQYNLIPGFGLWGIGFVHMVGNTAIAVTAALREMLDAGMFANFPGFLYAKALGRNNTLDLRVPPGGGVAIDTGGRPLSDVIMALPYKEPGAATLALIDNLVQTGQRVAGTADLPVGEGRQDAPVGTTIALIEQATKILTGIHKRIHQAQAKEFKLLKRLFERNPDSLWAGKKKEGLSGFDKQAYEAALKQVDLVPQADPNTASHMVRIMRAQAVKMLSTTNPDLYDVKAVDTWVLRMLRVQNPEALFSNAPAQPNPEAQAKAMSAQAQLLQANTDAADTAEDVKRNAMEYQARDADRQSDLQMAAIDAQKEKTKAQSNLAATQMKAEADMAKQAADHAHKMRQTQMEGAVAGRQQAMEHAHHQADQALDMRKQEQEHALDVHKQRSDQALDLHKHQTDLAQQAHEHETGLQHDAVANAMKVAQQQAATQQKAQQARQAAKKPAPKKGK